MAIVIPELTEAVQAIGDAFVFKSSDFAAGDWEPLGIVKAGAIEVTTTPGKVTLTIPEQTGELAHQQRILSAPVVLNFPLTAIEDLETMLAGLSPTGSSGGGYSAPQIPDEFSFAIVPRHEVGDGLTYNGSLWSPAAPKAAMWIWRATIEYGALTYDFNQLRMDVPVTITGMYYGANPEGHKTYSFGNPVTAGITSLRVNDDES